LSSFTFPCYHYPLQRLSFPPRRSSDLRPEPVPAHLGRHRLRDRPAPRRPHEARPAEPREHDVLLGGQQVAPAHWARHSVAAVGRSEEHTSNSSHVKISYAVFCLKKKIS